MEVSSSSSSSSSKGEVALIRKLLQSRMARAAVGVRAGGAKGRELRAPPPNLRAAKQEKQQQEEEGRGGNADAQMESVVEVAAVAVANRIYDMMTWITARVAASVTW